MHAVSDQVLMNFQPEIGYVLILQDSSNKPVPIMLCGNKTDLRKPTSSSKQRDIVTTEQGSRLAKVCSVVFYHNIILAFQVNLDDKPQARIVIFTQKDAN